MRHPQLVHSQNPVRVTPLQLHSHITILLQFKPTPGTYQRSCMLVYDGIWQIIFQDQNFPRRSLNQCYGPQLDYGVKHGFRSCFLALLIILVINQLPVFAVIDMLPQCFPYLFFSLATTMAGSMGGQATYNPALSSNAYNPTSTYSPTGSANSGKKISQSIGLIRATQFHHNTSLTAFRTYKLNTSL